MIDRSRGGPALQKFFTESFEGVLITDFWRAWLDVINDVVFAWGNASIDDDSIPFRCLTDPEDIRVLLVSYPLRARTP